MRKKSHMGRKAGSMARKSIKFINSAVNYIVLMVILILIAFAGYALWDSNQIYQAADKSNYAIYKPTIEDEGKSFKELQAVNAEVFAWLTVYGTNIDYPVTQGTDNMKYVSTNAEGLYSLSGAIFLDSYNNKNFRDFNNILYGHHMEKKKMFGEIGNFSDKDMFDNHRYGNLYFDEKDHGLEFFAFIHTDAYNSSIFTANVDETQRQAYLDNLLASAMYTRDIGVTADDRIILLSTCSSTSTNGRDILIARITDETYEDPFINAGKNNEKKQTGTDGLAKELQLLNLILIILLIVLVIVIIYRRKNRKRS